MSRNNSAAEKGGDIEKFARPFDVRVLSFQLHGASPHDSLTGLWLFPSFPLRHSLQATYACTYSRAHHTASWNTPCFYLLASLLR